MLTIRLTRKGKKNQPFFRVVVVDKRRSAKGGRAVEVLGHLDPLTKRKSLKKERILYWLKSGAQPSATVHNLLISEKIIEGKKIHVAKAKKSAEAGVKIKTEDGPKETANAPAEAKKPAEGPKEPIADAEDKPKLDQNEPASTEQKA